MRKLVTALALATLIAGGAGCKLFRRDDDRPSHHYYPPAPPPAAVVTPTP